MTIQPGFLKDLKKKERGKEENWSQKSKDSSKKSLTVTETRVLIVQNGGSTFFYGQDDPLSLCQAIKNCVGIKYKSKRLKKENHTHP